MTEYTYTNRDHDEVMVNRDDEGEITGVYTYRDAKFLRRKHDGYHFASYPTELAQRVKWRPDPRRKNSIFLHANHPAIAYATLLALGFTAGGEDLHEG